MDDEVGRALVGNQVLPDIATRSWKSLRDSSIFVSLHSRPRARSLSSCLFC